MKYLIFLKFERDLKP